MREAESPSGHFSGAQDPMREARARSQRRPPARIVYDAVLKEATDARSYSRH